ncbi:hypothetical protein [Hymenobacter crusticola]|uniref:Uncharacterized protein n=1 Tax=Hymenobacter crusticola TaxID=1770526 RepID=A0A243WL52_9BACT|nr:hypothetical protein [Hymenobacter crusticola]OUJ76027.1 hypothetical protein BXP70_01755 [Hymenobacter crusticola]
MRYQLISFLRLGLVFLICLLSEAVYAQQNLSRIVIVHPVVGKIINQQEKFAFGLFPKYRLEDFQEASFWRFASLDSTRGSILLQVTLRDGNVRTQSYSERDFQRVRNSIERQCRATLADQKYKEDLAEHERKRLERRRLYNNRLR